MKIKAAFLCVEDTPPDLILSFAEPGDSPVECQSLILMRTKKYEKLKYEFERGVNISWEGDQEEREFDEVMTSFKWNHTLATITSPDRTIEVGLSDIPKNDLKKMPLQQNLWVDSGSGRSPIV
ncbi:MAG: hypothetical protein GY801_13940 [bacterium]|nr:hypothetical protein [bacterium]